MRIPFFKEVSWYLVLAMFAIGIAPRVDAGFVPSEVVNAEFNRAMDLQKIQKVIEMKMIEERLGKLGFSSEEISSRFEQLSDLQIHQLALNLDTLKVGGDGLEIVIALLVIAILVVILLQITGHKVIVK